MKKLLCCYDCGSDELAWEIQVNEFGKQIYEPDEFGLVGDGAICQNPNCVTHDNAEAKAIPKSEFKGESDFQKEVA